MGAKTEFLQIRVDPGEKRLLRRLAQAAGLDLSAYVLTRSLPRAKIQFAQIVESLGKRSDDRYALAELNDLLARLAPVELAEAVEAADLARLSPFQANYVAAMVEQASHAAAIALPEWTKRVPPLEEPWFATPLVGLRLHLLHAAPVAFKSRNLFPDSGVGDRV